MRLSTKGLFARLLLILGALLIVESIGWKSFGHNRKINVIADGVVDAIEGHYGLSAFDTLYLAASKPIFDQSLNNDKGDKSRPLQFGEVEQLGHLINLRTQEITVMLVNYDLIDPVSLPGPTLLVGISELFPAFLSYELAFIWGTASVGYGGVSAWFIVTWFNFSNRMIWVS